VVPGCRRYGQPGGAVGRRHGSVDQMQAISAILYFLTQHSLLSLPLIVACFAGIATLLAAWRRNGSWFLLIIAGFVLGMVNIFTGHVMNALFLNAYGTLGSAVVTYEEETSSQLNDQNIWAYDAVVKTADGEDVVASFDTMSATIYPVRNEIRIPPVGERFVVKYIPGLAHNFVIMSDLSDYGRRQAIGEGRSLVEKAAIQFAASPANQAFIAEYREALTTFLNVHRGDADPALISDYQARLDALTPSPPIQSVQAR
jgi:hypothetical protein